MGVLCMQVMTYLINRNVCDVTMTLILLVHAENLHYYLKIVTLGRSLQTDASINAFHYGQLPICFNSMQIFFFYLPDETWVCMYVCMYVCVYVCMYVCMYLCMYVCMYVCMSVCMYVCMYICMYVCMHVRMYLCMYVSMYLCIYISMNMYMYVCVSLFYALSILDL